MSMVDIVIPTVGESINEANVGRFIIANGSWANKGEAVLEMETDKASMEIVAPESGTVKYSVSEGDLVAIGTSIGQIDTSAEKPAQTESAPATAENSSNSNSATSKNKQTSNSSERKYTKAELKGLGPAKRKALREGKISLQTDTINSGSIGDTSNGKIERKPMSFLRKKIAERLMSSQQTTASLTTFNEVDMSNILNLRKKLKADFEKKFGVRLGFMSFFSKALCAAKAEVPSVNAQIETSEADGTQVAFYDDVNISIAVSTDRGLVVPVIRKTNNMSFAQIESGIVDMAEKARSGKLGIEDMMGGTITLTNGGVFGSLLSTPILNPPQSGILGMHKTEQRPMAIPQEDGSFTVEVRPMMYLALTYDHRLVDGKESVTFLVKVKEYLETVTEEEIMQGGK